MEEQIKFELKHFYPTPKAIANTKIAILIVLMKNNY